MLGLLIAACGLGLAAVFIVFYFTSHPLPGFIALAVLTLLVGGFIIASTGIIELYGGKMVDQVKGRRLYVVERRTRPADAAGPLEATSDTSATSS